ncbi:MAG TPA: BatD family protein, partial [Candidatus Acidoferrales bacterium]|nr:BatD family protein [Candidatus Acidoferrales bacterium]
AGRYTIGPFAIDYKGSKLQTSSFNVEIVAAGQTQTGASGSAGSQQSLRLALSTPRTEVYLNERIAIDVNLYVGPVRVADVQNPPAVNTDGFSVDKWEDPTQHQETINGQTFQVVHFQTTLTPLRSGSSTIGPASVTLNVLERRRGGGMFDDDFFGFSQRHQVTVKSDPLTLNVLPLPDEGKPANFGGAVGTFTLAVNASPTEVNAGDPVTVTMTVQGHGTLPDTAAPMLSSTKGFRTYETHITKSEGDTKVFEQVLIPNDAQITVLPAVRFSYFDSEKHHYENLESAPIALAVRPAEQPQRAEVMSAVPRPAKPEELGHDIVYIKDDPGNLQPVASGFGVLAALYLPLPALLFIGASWYDRRRTRLTGDERYARFTRAGRAARSGFAAAEQALTQQNRSAFYDALFRTLQDYLAAKLNLPPGAIDAEAAAARGVSADVAEKVRRVLTTCEQARFAPVGDSADLRATLSTAQEIVKNLERQRRRASDLAALLLLGIAFAAAHALADTPSPQTTFFHANALYKDGQYTAAANEYEEILKQGLASGNAYFNLGNAHFKAGEKGKAILNYERARRLLPSDPDVAANLGYAQSLTGATPCTPALWQRIAFPLAQRTSSSALTWTVLAFYSLCFFALTAHRLLPSHPRPLVSVAWISGALLLVSGASWGWQLAADRDTQAVVTAPGETKARFEPAANGTEHYVLKEGSLVKIGDRREGWLQVERCDGLRGWVETKALEQLAISD